MNRSSHIRYSLPLITWGCCLFMVFSTGVSSPLITKLIQELGGTPLQVGLYGGIPLIALSMQFIGALMARRMSARKPAFMIWIILGRLLYLPALLVPMHLTQLHNAQGVTWMLFFLFLGNMLNHMATPLFYSWMGDLIPRRVLHRYWGVRATWSSAVWVVSYLGIMFLSTLPQLPFYPLLTVLIAVSVVSGIIDILLFVSVHEPPVVPCPPANVREILLQPLLDRSYRRLVLFFSGWNAATVCAAVQMGFYLFAVMDMPVWKATLIWSLQGLGAAVSAKGWGRLAQRRGCVFLLRVGILFKPIIGIAFVLIRPENAFAILLPVSFFDGMWNAAYGVGQNGLMFHNSPPRDRAMFVAAMTGFCGFVGGLSAALGGKFIDTFAERRWDLPWGEANAFQMIFLLSSILRLAMALWAWRLEPDKPVRDDPWLSDLLDVWPFRAFRYPVGLYNNWQRRS
jgi:MFS family permease